MKGLIKEEDGAEDAAAAATKSYNTSAKSVKSDKGQNPPHQAAHHKRDRGRSTHQSGPTFSDGSIVELHQHDHRDRMTLQSAGVNLTQSGKPTREGSGVSTAETLLTFVCSSSLVIISLIL